MSKRYFYWRTPEGKPYCGNDDKYAPIEIIARCGKISKVSPEGNVSWEAFPFERIKVALKMASIVLYPNGEELNEHDTWMILRFALTDAARKTGSEQPLNSRDVFDFANIKAAEFFRKQEDPYFIISGLSIKSLPIKSTCIDGFRIMPLDSRRSFPYPDHVKKSEDPFILNYIDSPNYLQIRINTSGRSFYEAADKAFRVLHIFRGLLSLFATFGSWEMVFGGVKRDPIGIIYSGPIHTLYKANGKPVGDIFWYDQSANAHQKIYEPSNGWIQIEKNRRRAMRKISKLSYKSDVEDLIIRYAIALDQPDHDIAFLFMWSILEKITNTVGGRYDETLEKATWLFKERKLDKNILSCLRLRRNLYVHASHSSEQSDQAAYLIKHYVDNHLINLIRNSYEIATLEEYGQLLSLPVDLETLSRDIMWRKKTIQNIRKRIQKK